jgi:hypothetical protein
MKHVVIIMDHDSVAVESGNIPYNFLPLTAKLPRINACLLCPLQEITATTEPLGFNDADHFPHENAELPIFRRQGTWGGSGLAAAGDKLCGTAGTSATIHEEFPLFSEAATVPFRSISGRDSGI